MAWLACTGGECKVIKKATYRFENTTESNFEIAAPFTGTVIVTYSVEADDSVAYWMGYGTDGSYSQLYIATGNTSSYFECELESEDSTVNITTNNTTQGETFNKNLIVEIKSES